MNYLKSFQSGQVEFDFDLFDDGRRFRFANDPDFGGSVFRVTPRYESQRGWAEDIYNIIRRGQHTHLHIHSGWAGALLLPLAARLPVRRVYHSHNVLPTTLGGAFFKRETARAVINALAQDRFACSGDAGRQMFFRSFKVLPNVINYSDFGFDSAVRARVREQLGLGDGELVVGHVGHFHAQKNHHFLIKVFAQLHKQVQTARLMLVGHADEAAQTTLQTWLHEHGVDHSAVILGQRTDVAELYQAFDIFLFPSLFEGFGMALLEAQVSGLPCIYSSHIPRDAVIAEYALPKPLTDGSAAWADAVLALSPLTLDEQERRYRASTVRHTFDAPDRARELEEFYLSTVPARSGSSG